MTDIPRLPGLADANNDMLVDPPKKTVHALPEPWIRSLNVPASGDASHLTRCVGRSARLGWSPVCPSGRCR